MYIIEIAVSNFQFDWTIGLNIGIIDSDGLLLGMETKIDKGLVT
jgi:hypothetical protein